MLVKSTALDNKIARELDAKNAGCIHVLEVQGMLVHADFKILFTMVVA